MIQVGNITISKNELVFQFVRSSGPGGQNVNKVNTKVVLFFNVEESPSIPPEIKSRFVTRWKNKISIQGEVVLSSDQFRTQGQNIDEVVEKLREMIEEVLVPPKKRVKTKPTRGSTQRLMKEKILHSQNKKNRMKIDY